MATKKLDKPKKGKPTVGGPPKTKTGYETYNWTYKSAKPPRRQGGSGRLTKQLPTNKRGK